MKTISVPEKAMDAVRTDGKCIVRYCPGNTIPASLEKGEQVIITGRETRDEIFAEVQDKQVATEKIEVMYRKCGGLA